MGSTANWDIYYLDNGDPQSQVTESSVQASTVEAALDQVGGNIESVNNFGVRFFANASARDLELTSPGVGWLSQLGSELFVRRWNGSAWRPFGPGMFPLKPTSVSGNGVSVDAEGLVSWQNNGGGTVTDANSVCIDGVFTTEFRKFVVDFVVESMSEGATSFWVRAGGVTQEGPDTYSRAYAHVAGTTYAGDSNTFTSGVLTTAAQISASGTLELFNPAAANFPTRAVTQFGGVAASGTGRAGYSSSVFITSMLIDGIRLRPATGSATWTGSCRIFGVL